MTHRFAKAKAKSLRSAWEWVARTIDLGDVAVAIGLGLIVWGFWDVSRAIALIVPGAVLVWYGLPPRPPFIHRAKE